MIITLRDPGSSPPRTPSEIDVAGLIRWVDGRPVEEHTVPTRQRLGNDLLRCVSAYRPTKLVFDFAGLHKIGCDALFSSAMNGVYGKLIYWARQSGCRLLICGVADPLREVFPVCMRFRDVYATVAEALAAFEQCDDADGESLVN